MHPHIRDQLNLVETDWPRLPQFPCFPARVSATISDFCQSDENRDGRGLRVEARDVVLRTLRHIRSAERKATQASVTPSLAKEARKFLKSLGHNVEFERTVNRARRFAGEMQRSGRRVARARLICDPLVRSLGMLGSAQARVRRVTSEAELTRVGCQLDLCVAKRDAIGRDYHARLKNGEMEFWCLEAANRSIALLGVVESDGLRQVSEFDGPRHDRPHVVDRTGSEIELPSDLLRRLLSEIDATADDNEHFCQAGVFRSLLQADARERRRVVVVDSEVYSVWRFPTEVIVAKWRVGDGKALPPQWSRFVRSSINYAKCSGIFGRPLARRRRRPARTSPQQAYEWREATWHSGSMDIGEFHALVLRSPELYAAVADR